VLKSAFARSALAESLHFSIAAYFLGDFFNPLN